MSLSLDLSKLPYPLYVLSIKTHIIGYGAHHRCQVSFCLFCIHWCDVNKRIWILLGLLLTGFCISIYIWKVIRIPKTNLNIWICNYYLTVLIQLISCIGLVKYLRYKECIMKMFKEVGADTVTFSDIKFDRAAIRRR